MKNKSTLYPLLLVLYILISSCSKNPQSPGIEFMPGMYRSPSYETYSSNYFFADSISARSTVPGTIARGFMPYPYANDTAGYGSAGRNLKNPLVYSDIFLAEGEVLYTKFCVHCHGANGAGDGLVAGKLPGPPPSYTTVLKDLPEGKIFHSVTYGKNLMGSHAGQLSKEEIWKIVFYAQKLQHPNGVATKTDSVATKPGTQKKKNKK